MLFNELLQSVDLSIFIPYSIAFVVLLIASYTDIKTREVPDWLNFGLIGAGFGINLLFSIIYWKFSFIVNSLVGFFVFFILALIMFYTGQWGGGDSKILMALGALIGLDVFSEIFHQFLIGFVINSLLIGALYGLVWSFILIFRNKNAFLKALKKKLSNEKTRLARKIILILFIVFIFAGFVAKDFSWRIIFLYLALISVITFYLWLIIKSVENSCMLKYVKPQQLTEGDWIAKEIKINGKYITGPKDLGIEKNQINKLIGLYKKRKIKMVLIKEGMPFVPSFFIAYVVTLIFGNLVFFILI